MTQKRQAREERIYSELEVANMIAQADSLRDKALIGILYLTGCRISEALGLQKQDIYIKRKRMVISLVTLKRQDGLRRDLIISTEAPFMELIEEYWNSMPDPESSLFPISRQHAWRIITKNNELAYCHWFRHTRLTKLAMIGATEAQLRQWTGWRELKNADTYIMRSTKIIENLANKID